MKKINMTKIYTGLVAFAFLFLLGSSQVQAAVSLAANTAYTVELYKMNSDGSTTLVSTTSVTSDASSKIAFSFTSVPTQATNKFLIIKVKNAAGTVVTQSFSPAPAASGTNSLGVNTTSTVQAKTMVTLGTLLGSDDPIAVSFGLMFTRDPATSASDITQLATIANEAIIKGMEVYMLANGATAGQMTTFKNAIVYNATVGAQDLRAFSTLFKSAIDTPGTADEDMAKASGLVASIFIDAAAKAGIDLDLILAAFDDAGVKLGSGAGLAAMNAASNGFKASMTQSVNNFFTRLSAVKVKGRYNAALTALDATPAQKTRFTTGVDAMMTAMAAVDTLFMKYFDGTTGYDSTETINIAHTAGRVDKTVGVIAAGITVGGANGLTGASTINQAINYAFSKAFTDFSVAIKSTNQEITDLKTAVAAALGIAVNTLPADFGKFRDVGANKINWPVPQAASVNFLAISIAAGGGMTYTRDTTAVPANMAWLAGTRSTFTGGSTPATFAALLGMQEDLMILDFVRFYLWNPGNGATGGNPTQVQQQTAKKAFMTGLATIVGNIAGTIDGTVVFTAAQKKALVKSQQQPSLN